MSDVLTLALELCMTPLGAAELYWPGAALQTPVMSELSPAWFKHIPVSMRQRG